MAEQQSPSPRRAWIEIPKEGFFFRRAYGSPSPRRAWIEITKRTSKSIETTVALPTEGVD